MAQAEDLVTAARPPAAGGRTSEDIRADIERTRAELDETLAALDSKLAPAQIRRDAWKLVKDRSSVQAGKLHRIAREHPLPTAAIGLGAGLLLGWRFLRRGEKTQET
jgi:ElaB/YqjD/DUF883 family membrane-anchored ribosome-binding protein